MSKFIYQCKPMHELRSLLQEATLTELRDVLSLGNVRGRSKLNREGLENAAYKMLTEPYVIGYLVMTFVNASAWSVVERALCEREVTLGAEDDDTVLEMAEALYLADRSMLVKVYSWKGKLIAVSPKEVKAAYRKANEDNIQSQEKWAQVSLDHIAAACANFYGVVCRDEFDKYVAAYASEALKEYQNGYANEQAYKDAQRELLDTISVLSDEYVVDDEYIASTAFEDHSQDGDVPKIDHESVESVIQSRQSKKVFMPSAEEFLKYARSDYYEHTTQTEALRAHLKRITGEKLRADEIDEILLDIHWAALCNRENVSAVITDVTERLEKHDVSLNLNAMNRLLGFITDMQNNTRLWDNYGNTPEELMKSSDYQPRAIRFGPGMMDAFKDGDDMNPDELLRKVNDIPFPNKEMRDSFIQQVFSAKKEVETSVPMSTGKIGRNQPCPCGSGKKYKNCCGKNK